MLYKNSIYLLPAHELSHIDTTVTVENSPFSSIFSRQPSFQQKLLSNTMNMIQKLRSAIICTVLGLGMHTASAQTFGWAKQLGNAEWDEGIAIATDAAGNVYSIGNFYDTVDFDP